MLFRSVMSKFVDCARDQAFLLPPDLRDWIPEDDLAHFVIEAVERVEMSAFKVNHRGTGSAQYHPRMMLALLIYCYANGIFSSRRIERATHRDIGVRFVAANAHPDHDTIATFRRENFAAVAESFLQVLLLAKELKLVKVGVVSVDGTKIDANGSKHRSVRYDRAGELTAQLQLEISALMARAEASDGSGEEDPQALPKELAHKQALRDKLVAARGRLEAQAKVRAEAAGEKNWPPKMAEFQMEMLSEIFVPFPFTPLFEPGKVGPLFEWRSYTVKPGAIGQVQDLPWASRRVVHRVDAEARQQWPDGRKRTHEARQHRHIGVHGRHTPSEHVVIAAIVTVLHPLHLLRQYGAGQSDSHRKGDEQCRLAHQYPYFEHGSAWKGPCPAMVCMRPLRDMPRATIGPSHIPPSCSASASSVTTTRNLFQSTVRSEEHTSELQSRRNLVCRLLLEKKKHKTTHTSPTLIPTYFQHSPLS